MNCQHAQQLFDDLNRDRLPDAVATRVRQHLADCTDCRVQQQRFAKLQRLLALTRYEQPPPGYFDGVLTDFHRRQVAFAQRPAWWSRLAALLASGGRPGWSYAFAGAALAICVWGAYWLQTSAPGDTAINAAGLSAGAIPTTAGPVVNFAAAPTPTTWEPVVVTVTAQPAPAPALVAVTPPAAPAPGQTPRYVLDRLPIVAASYDPARADF